MSPVSGAEIGATRHEDFPVTVHVCARASSAEVFFRIWHPSEPRAEKPISGFRAVGTFPRQEALTRLQSDPRWEDPHQLHWCKVIPRIARKARAA